MKNLHSRFTGLATLTAACLIVLTLSSRPAFAQVHTVQTQCADAGGTCFEILNPNPVMISVGEQVNWFINPNCAVPPCSGRCQIIVPPGPGFPGFNDVVVAGNFSATTPPFALPGNFPYSLECSPPTLGTIIVSGGGLTLGQGGTCPGTITMSVIGATPGARIYFAYGFSSGSTSVPGCAGVSVGIRAARLAGSDVADDNGEASISGFVPPSACGVVKVQAVELSTCTVSNIVTVM